jgi:hypothetical protein
VRVHAHGGHAHLAVFGDGVSKKRLADPFPLQPLGEREVIVMHVEPTLVLLEGPDRIRAGYLRVDPNLCPERVRSTVNAELGRPVLLRAGVRLEQIGELGMASLKTRLIA